MKTSIIQLLILSCFLFSSCEKESEENKVNGQIKTILAGHDMAAAACFQDKENNLIVIGRSFKNRIPGIIVKMDSEGNEISRNPVSSLNSTLWNTTRIDDGFITIGYENDQQSVAHICRYNYNSELVSSVSFNLLYTAVNFSPANIISLSNGNYALSISANALNLGCIYILDPGFNVISVSTFFSPEPDYVGCFFYGISQLTDSTIGFSASSTKSNSGPVLINSLLITTSLDGDTLSLTLLKDSIQSETTNCLVKNGNGILSVTSAMTGWNNNSGVYVNYLNDLNSQIISGRINLVIYDINGNFKERKKISSYPGNGLISSAKPTRDGGFILCGTVNQNNSSTIESDTRIYLLKLDENFNEQWSKVIETVSPSLGVDAFETNTGEYYLTGYQRSGNNKFNMIVIKTDGAGNI